MVALRLDKYADEIPQIGKVVKLTDMDVTVEWWIGCYSDTWREWKERGAVVTETFPRNAIIYSGIHFTKTFRLRGSTVNPLTAIDAFMRHFDLCSKR